MKKFRLGLLVFMAVVAVDRSCPAGPFSPVYTTINGRNFGYYVPDYINESTPDVPLLFMFHGMNGNNSEASGDPAENGYYGWQSSADENGFIVLFPDSLGVLKTWDLGSGGTSSDLPFVDDMIDWATTNYNISTSRIFTTGHSWGAYFSYYVARYRSDDIAAFAEHSGGLGGALFLGNTPPVPTGPSPTPKLNAILLHAVDDSLVPYSNSQDLYDDLNANGHNTYPGIIQVDGWGDNNHRYRLEHNQTQWDFFIDVTTQPGTWNNVGGGLWNVADNWEGSSGVPDANTVTATFGQIISGNATVVTDADVTVKSIDFALGTNTNSYVIAGHGTVRLEADSGPATMSVDAGSHQFQAPVSFLSTGTITLLGTSTLTLNNDVTLDNDVTAAVASGANLVFNSPLDVGANTLTNSGPGTMSINNALISSGGEVIVAAGTVGGIGTIGDDLTINPAGTVAPGNSIGTLSVDGAATVDGTLAIELTGNSTTDGSDESDMLAAGGILSAGADSIRLDWLEGSAMTSKFGGVYTVATYASLAGTPDDLKDMVNTAGNIGALYVDAVANTGTTSLNITLHDLGDGDNNIDGKVDPADFTLLLAGWDPLGTKAGGWATGDYNFDGKVDPADFTLFLAGWAPLGIDFSAAPSGEDAFSSAQPVPEPGTIVMLCMGVLGFLAYTRRRREH